MEAPKPVLRPLVWGAWSVGALCTLAALDCARDRFMEGLLLARGDMILVHLIKLHLCNVCVTLRQC